MSVQLTPGHHPRACWERHLSNGLLQRAFAARMFSANHDLRNTNVCIDVLAAKLVNGIEQAGLLLALQLSYSATANR